MAAEAREGGAAALCEAAAVEGAAASGVPVEVLSAIALTETGRIAEGRFRPWPWAVNREGDGYWFDSRDEALSFARASLAEGRTSFDLGCFQINFRWHGHNFASLDDMVDPQKGAAYAARFLRDLRDELGSWEAAAGAYHSRTPDLARRYRQRFERILVGLGGRPEGAEATERVQVASRKVRRVRAPLVITIPPEGAGFGTERRVSGVDVEVVAQSGDREVMSWYP